MRYNILSYNSKSLNLLSGIREVFHDDDNDDGEEEEPNVAWCFVGDLH